MSAARDLLAELELHRVHVERHGDRLRMRAPAPPPADLLARIKQRKADLLDVLPDADEQPLRAIVRWRSPTTPAGTWATALGAPGLTRQQVIDQLLARWPDSMILPD